MDVEISFKLLLKTLLKHLWLLIIITLIVALLAAAYTTFLVTPTYKATASCRILITDMNSTAGSNLQTTIQLLDAYSKAILSDDTLETASAMINHEKYSPSYIKNIISVSCDEGSITLYITAVDTNPENAAKIANVICEASAYCNADLAELTVNNRAVAPTAPSSPSLVINVFLASVVAFVLVYGFSLLWDIYNNKITTEDDLAQAIDIPVIGSIPLVDISEFKNAQTEGK